MKEDRSYGVIVVLRGAEDKFLCIKQTVGYWGFPKGHKEGNEKIKEAALRELKEETGIAQCNILDVPPIIDEYVFTLEGKEDYHKIVQYFIGLSESDVVLLQEDEILEYKWATYEQALEILTYENSKEVLKKAKEYLDKI